MRRIDLTGPIYEGMWTYGPPMPEVRLPRVASLEREGWDAHLIHMGNVQGTYLETAAHFQPGRNTIESVPLDRMFARAAVLNVGIKAPCSLITADDLVSTGVEVEPGMAVLVGTGWDRMWGSHRFYWDSPHFTREAMEWLADKCPAIFGVDISSADDPLNPVGLNNLIFDVGALLLAPLVNLGAITAPYVDLVALPLLIPGLCATPCRAIAIEP